jgi:tetratricopeptide (TPR) repeat protein
MRRLADELGVDPGPGLQRLHQQILRDSSDLQATVSPEPRQWPLPAQLPHDVRGFTGRDSDLAALHKLVSAANDAAVTTCVISGPAGVGKTALAVHFGHQVAGRFPDGQIYIDLYGFHPHRAALGRDEALGQLLRALDVDPQRIPADIDAQTALYRSLTASRRLLIVLDNAATADQVRPLLPGSAACIVLITSRNRMPGLVVRDEAYPVSLAVLNAGDARALLAGAVGRDRIEAEPDAADEVARLCGYLPLALRVVAARLSMYRHYTHAYTYTLADLAGQLAVERDRLDLLAVDDDETGAVRSALSWSYSALDSEAARVFRLLGLHTGPDFSVAAVAALTGTAYEEAHAVLGLLTSRNLLDQTARDRYRLHDLTRLYAAELASADKSSRDGAEAVARLMQWYLRTADAAGSVLLPNMRRVPIDPPEDMCGPLELETPREALAWCETEITNLVAITEHAAEIQENVVAWKIPMALWAFFTIRKRWNQWVTTTQIGLTAARRGQDQLGEAHMLTSLAYAYHDLQRFDDAIDHYQRALAAWAAIDDSWGRAAALTLFGTTHHELGRFDAAIDSFERARELFMKADDRWGHGWTLHNLARSYLELRRFDEAIDHCQRGLRLFREINDRWGQSWTLYQLGTGCWRLRRADEAIRYYHEAITICQQIGNRQAQAFALTSLANAFRHSRRLEEAFDHSRRALGLFREIGDARGEAAARIVLEKCYATAGV